MDEFIKCLILMNLALISCYLRVDAANSDFSQPLKPPRKYIRPKSILKYVLFHSNKNLGMVDVCFWTEIILLLLFVFSNVGIFLMNHYGLFVENHVLLWSYAAVVVFVPLIPCALCNISVHLNNGTWFNNRRNR